MKIKKPRSGGVLLPETKWTYTFYTRDAQGNVMSTYERPENSADLLVNDFQIYGSSRLGTYTVGESLASLAATNQYSLKTGKKNYELTNHLGNVMVTFTDVRKPKDTNAYGVIDSYEATVVSANDYYPFGMLMPGKNFNSPDYRYGFNGKEKDDDIGGSAGTTYDYGFRIYDSRIARFLSVDPLTTTYPELTPFQYASNNPIMNIDLDGLEGISAPPIATKQLTEAYNSNPKEYKTMIVVGTAIGLAPLVIEALPAVMPYVARGVLKAIEFGSKAKAASRPLVDFSIEFGVKAFNYVEANPIKIGITAGFMFDKLEIDNADAPSVNIYQELFPLAKETGIRLLDALDNGASVINSEPRNEITPKDKTNIQNIKNKPINMNIKQMIEKTESLPPITLTH